MTNQEIIDAVNAWQSNDRLHPLTCVQSQHRDLVPVEKENKVVLKCLDCDYVQAWIPDIVLS